MPRFCANISLLFTEVELPERFAAAARAGFKAVEIQFPYSHDCELLAARAREAGIEVVLINMPGGSRERGELGLGCLPSRVSEFRDGGGTARRYAAALGCKRVNCLGGIAPDRVPPATLRATFVSNLAFATREMGVDGIEVQIEPQNTRTFPGVFLRNTLQAVSILDEVG